MLKTVIKREKRSAYTVGNVKTRREIFLMALLHKKELPIKSPFQKGKECI
jgi:hypothetical protein